MIWTFFCIPNEIAPLRSFHSFPKLGRLVSIKNFWIEPGLKELNTPER